MYSFYKHILLAVFWLVPVLIIAQSNNRRPLTYYEDFNITTLRAEKPLTQMPVDSGRKYIVSDGAREKRAPSLKFAEQRGKYLSPFRTAKLFKTKYGIVMAFKVLISDGYEKVAIFGDRNYTRDSLLIANDTLFFKEVDDDQLKLRIVFPQIGDTLKIWYGYRNIRYDFLKKIVVNPPLHDKKYWMKDYPLDRMVTYTFIKSGNGYRIHDNAYLPDKSNASRVDYLRQLYQKCSSPFWAALAELSF